jgi:hypothetical protein
MQRFHTFVRRAALAVAAFAILGAAATVPGSADIRQNVANKAATDAANQFVAKIQGQSCADFATTMAQMKNKSPGATPSPMSAKLKSNPGARTTFVNIVAAPLLNKLIDCNMLPGGS